MNTICQFVCCKTDSQEERNAYNSLNTFCFTGDISSKSERLFWGMAEITSNNNSNLLSNVNSTKCNTVSSTDSTYLFNVASCRNQYTESILNIADMCEKYVKDPPFY